MLLVVAVAAVALSCGLDYTLDFELGDIAVLGNSVEVDYTLTNAGFRSMDNATINIRVTVDRLTGGSLPPMELWTPGVDLSVGDIHSGTLSFPFGESITNPLVEVIGAGWDEHISSD
ncbi:MAG: hypothetical protein NTU62_15490 [Spirochaetes bacterium]|nr:hypothetical protein [Spirochaetota bacterium]